MNRRDVYFLSDFLRSFPQYQFSTESQSVLSRLTCNFERPVHQTDVNRIVCVCFFFLKKKKLVIILEQGIYNGHGPISPCFVFLYLFVQNLYTILSSYVGTMPIKDSISEATRVKHAIKTIQK